MHSSGMLYPISFPFMPFLTDIIAPHPLLSQVPLRISPQISLPRAPTLPYTYTPLPHSLPPSSTPGAPPSSTSASSPDNDRQHKFVVAPNSGHTAHPDDIIRSCRTLLRHIEEVEQGNKKLIEDWEKRLKEEDVLEKRRRAPGWLDRDEKILEPERRKTISTPHPETPTTAAQDPGTLRSSDSTMDQRPTEHDQGGEELDRAFGGLGVR